MCPWTPPACSSGLVVFHFQVLAGVTSLLLTYKAGLGWLAAKLSVTASLMLCSSLVLSKSLVLSAKSTCS